MKLGRRGFLRIASLSGSAAIGLSGHRAEARSLDSRGASQSSVLVDLTLCVGCRACEAACSEANDLPPPPEEVEGKGVRDTSPDSFTVVNSFRGAGSQGADRFVKRQCMACIDPACASACPVRALDKQPNGPVIYRGERCMGCRYCMVACPFEIPKYQYDKRVPLVRKCTFCADRQARGKGPACAEVCPSGALTFGTRSAMLDLAKRRIFGSTGKYLPHVYGEHEAGGTDWLYVSDVPFERLGLPAVRDELYPDKVQGALSTPAFVMTLWPPLLMGLYAFSKRREAMETASARDEIEGGRHGDE